MIGILAGVENIFPPVPADTAVALGAFLSHGGTVSALGVFAVTWTVNVATASGVYLTARTVGRRFFEGPLGRRLLRPKALAKLEQLYDRYGLWGIFLSRFIPAVRAVVPPFAGVARLGAVRTIVPMATASAIWYGTLTLLIVELAARLEDVRRLLAQVHRAALLGALAIAALIVIFAILRRHRKRQEHRGMR